MANYTGYGTDPNFIYSFRGGGPYAGLGLTAAESGFQQLRQSLAYRQAGMEGKQRMEQAVGMGLPFNTDLNKVQKVGIDRFGPIYAAPRPQPWGTFGSIGMDREERSTPPPPPPPPPPPDAPTPPPIEIKKTELGESGAPIAFTPFGKMARQESQPQPKAGSIFSAGIIGSLTGFGGIPRFPFANY